MKIRLPNMFDFGFKQTRSWTGQVRTYKGENYGQGPFKDARYIAPFKRLMRFGPDSGRKK